MLILREAAPPEPGAHRSGIPGRAWDEWVAAHGAGHFLQSDAWARVRAAGGWRTLRLEVVEAAGASAVPVAGIQVLVRHTPIGRFAYAPRGPVCDPSHPAWPMLVAGLRARLRGAIQLRVEPPWDDRPTARAVLTDAGFREAEPVQPPSSVVLDLTASEERLLAGMAQKCRYNVRLAERRGVEVFEGGPGDLATFEELMAQTAARHGLGSRRAGYYEAVAQAFGPAARLYGARYADQVVAMILVIRFGRSATYLYGASSGEHAEHMPNHALQWCAIVEARRAGCSTYDFWGAPDALGRQAAAGGDLAAVPEASGGLWGVWRFKRGFGGTVTRTVGAWDDVYSPVRHALVERLLPAVRRVSRRA